MLAVISPAKTLDFESAPLTTKSSNCDYLEQSSQLISTMRQQSPKQLSKLMKISPKLAELNAQRYTDWNLADSTENTRQALLAFKGDVYLGLAVENYTAADFTFAQKNLRILSGLYGLLKPLDLIQPYRLEMGTKINTANGNNLYQFWGDDITNGITTALASHRNKSLINLASNEYFKAINPNLLPGKLITPIFKDYSNGSYKVLGFFAKKARGYMSTFIIKNRIKKPEDLKLFSTDGYKFDPDLSSEFDWVFSRKIKQ
ncbi:MAG: peroxide stress protein YaaA [Pseudomonadales bacterium]|nr:peroxide stress protein YaaA [Pseudomonadales bacterium]